MTTPSCDFVKEEAAFRVGDVVEVRSSASQPWRPGRVATQSPLTVTLDGYDQSDVFELVRHKDADPSRLTDRRPSGSMVTHGDLKDADAAELKALSSMQTKAGQEELPAEGIVPGDTTVATSSSGQGAKAKAPASPGPEGGLWHQEAVGKFYNGISVQVTVACLIGTNFLTNMVEKQIDPAGNLYSEVFAGLDIFYNVAFTLELAVNMYAHWFCYFWRSSWNIFDTVVVSIGVINLLKLPLPSAFNLLRLMRAFRVFRLFKRVKALNKIIVSIINAVPGVANAFLILTIVMCIYAILAVEFYQDVGEGCESTNYTNVEGASGGYYSLRQQCFGQEYFGTFTKAIYTFFQVLTGESWSEMVARPAIWYFSNDWFRATASALFFVSFVLVTAYLLINVVVAVLLDKMSATEPEDEAPPEDPDEKPEPVPLSAKEIQLYRNFHRVGHSLEKLVAKQTDMQTEFDRTRNEMAAMKEQIGSLAKVIQNRRQG